MSAGIPINLCSLRIIEIDRLRFRFKTFDTRALLPIHGSKSFRDNQSFQCKKKLHQSDLVWAGLAIIA